MCYGNGPCDGEHSQTKNCSVQDCTGNQVNLWFQLSLLKKAHFERFSPKFSILSFAIHFHYLQS